MGNIRKWWVEKQTKEQFALGRSQGATMALPRNSFHRLFATFKEQRMPPCASEGGATFGCCCDRITGSDQEREAARSLSGRVASLHKSALTWAFKYPTWTGFNCWGLEVTQMRVLAIE